MAENDEIKVTGEFLPDPNMCLFQVNRPILDGHTIIFKSADDSMGSPLIDALFAVEGITRVKVSGSEVTLSKNIETPWPELAKFILPAIRDPLSSGQDSISSAAIEKVKADPAEDMAELINQLLEGHINPALAAHGGYVKLVKIEGRDVFIEMGGGCQGCAASKLTMKHGVETAIRDVCPQVGEIVDVTDHAAGTNPYYQ